MKIEGKALNIELKNQFNRLDYAGRYKVLSEISSLQRSSLVEVLVQEQFAKWNEEQWTCFKTAIEKESAVDRIKITRASPLEVIEKVKRSVIKWLDYMLFTYFSYVSAHRACILFSEAKHKQILCQSIESSFPLVEKTIDQTRLKDLLITARSSGQNLQNLLHQEGFSTKIEDISAANLDFSKIDLEGIEFKNCYFFGETKFCQARLVGTSFINCKLEGCYFYKAQLDKVHFVGSELNMTSFMSGSLDLVQFTSSTLHGCSFEETKITHTKWSSCHLYSLLFLESIVDHIEFTHCYLRQLHHLDEKCETIKFIDNEKSEDEERIAVMTHHPKAKGLTNPKVSYSLEHESHLLPMRLSQVASQEVEDALSCEVKKFFDHNAEIKISHLADLLEKAQSNPEEYPIVHQCLEKAKKVVQSSHAVLLPGGEDLPPVFYGEKPSSESRWSGKYYHTILEAALLHEAIAQDKPLRGICRGFQLICIYHGAKIVQHVSDQEDLQYYQIHEALQDVGGFRIEGLRGVSSHHQAIEVGNKGLQGRVRELCSNGPWLKGAQIRDHNILGVQFHPEYGNGVSLFSDVKGRVIDEVLNFVVNRENRSFWTSLEFAKPLRVRS